MRGEHLLSDTSASVDESGDQLQGIVIPEGGQIVLGEEEKDESILNLDGSGYLEQE